MAAKTKADTKPKQSKTAPIWEYFEVQFKLRTEMLATCTEANITINHLLKRAQKNIEKANQLGTRKDKLLEKYRGSEISPEKEIKEIQSIIMTFGEMIGEVQDDLPNDMDELAIIAEEVEEKFNELVKKGEQAKSTIFMKMPFATLPSKPEGVNVSDDTMWPIISSHMVLGNLKENAKIITNNGDKSIFNTKVSISETLALDVKPVEEFLVPNKDIKRNEDGKPFIDERPIRFIDNKGKQQTAINCSEVLPVGAEFRCVLRIRKQGPIDLKALKRLFELGKSNGLGAWRGSGNRGSYFYKVKALKDYKEPVPKGWN